MFTYKHAYIHYNDGQHIIIIIIIIIIDNIIIIN